MDNQIPVTGFERHIKIDLDGVLMSVPYGYLAGTSRESATKWMSDEEKVYKGGRFDIYVHAVWKNGSWELEPFNRENSEKFVKGLKDGLVKITEISLRKGCDLKVNSLIDFLTYMKIPKKHSDITDYVIYENVTEQPFYHEINYIRIGDRPVNVSVKEHRKNGELQYFSSFVNSCVNGISISYYPHLYEDKLEQPKPEDLVEYHQQVENLVNSFIK